MTHEEYIKELDTITADEKAIIKVNIDLMNDGKISAHEFTYLMGEAHEAACNRASEAFEEYRKEATTHDEIL